MIQQNDFQNFGVLIKENWKIWLNFLSSRDTIEKNPSIPSLIDVLEGKTNRYSKNRII